MKLKKPKTKKDLKKKNEKLPELRKDLVTGEWVVIVPGRQKKPNDYKVTEFLYDKARKEILEKESIKKCPFEDLSRHYHDATLIYSKTKQKKDWSVMSIPNDYPSFIQDDDLDRRSHGIFSMQDAVGYHEVIITRDHQKPLALMSHAKVRELLTAYQERYINLMNRKYVNYVLIMQNHGLEAGASLVHPHSQLFAIPIVSKDIERKLNGSLDYYRHNGECVYCTIVNHELKVKERIIYENEHFVAICPFVSMVPFEISILPKKHSPYFERSNKGEIDAAADALRVCLKKLRKGLNNPSYNYYVRTSPCDGLSYEYYHWHLKILPRLSKFAGFELGTGVEINTMPPGDATQFFKGIKV